MIRSSIAAIAIVIGLSLMLAQDGQQQGAEPDEQKPMTTNQHFVKTLEEFEALKRAALTEAEPQTLIRSNQAFAAQVTLLKEKLEDKPPVDDAGEPAEKVVPKKTTIGAATIKPGNAVQTSNDPDEEDIQSKIAATLKTYRPTLKLREPDEVRESKLAKLGGEKLAQLCSKLLQSSEKLGVWMSDQEQGIASDDEATRRQLISRLMSIEETLRRMTHQDRPVEPGKIEPGKIEPGKAEPQP